MAERWFLLVARDGSHTYVNRPEGALPPRWDREGSRPVAVPRPPEPGERWDFEAGEFICDDAVAADAAVSPEHIATAHIIKQVEAAIVLSGVLLDHGLLADEAAAKNISIVELAIAVLDAAAGFRAAEVARQARKHKARSKG